MPGSLPNSLEWHRNQVLDLLTMVEVWGLPSLFRTLTTDEVSETRWREIDDMEQLPKRLNKTFTWQDAPVECAALFHLRVRAFMKEHILNEKGGILRKVLHHVIRYEEQGQGSLHAHIILWVDPKDVDRITNEISATIPAEFDDATGEFKVPLDPNLCTLFCLVTRKNQHVYKNDGCLKDRDYCKYGFPFKPYSDVQASFNVSSGRWDYFRLRKVDRNTVTYHPIIMILWGAHCNLLRITTTCWSYHIYMPSNANLLASSV